MNAPPAPAGLLDSIRIGPYTDWGGTAWASQVKRGIQWLGDVRGLRILEVGAGHGGMSALFGLLGATVVGIDVNAASLAAARIRADDSGVGGQVTFEQRSGDPEDLPRGFDIAFAKSVLVLSRDLEAALAGIRATLVEGGRVVVIENARGTLPVQVARMVWRWSVQPHAATYFTGASVHIFRRHFTLGLERWTSTPPTVLLGGTAVSPAPEASPPVIG